MAQCRYAECCYAECHYDKCRVAGTWGVMLRIKALTYNYSIISYYGQKSIGQTSFSQYIMVMSVSQNIRISNITVI
jgi:hypothetical protein